MTTFTPRNNSGATFKNERKDKDTHPDYKGSALIGGLDYWVSTWVKTDKSGKKYFSHSFKQKESQIPDETMIDERYKQDMSKFDDDIPF